MLGMRNDCCLFSVYILWVIMKMRVPVPVLYSIQGDALIRALVGPVFYQTLVQDKLFLNLCIGGSE
jgi:hypothetical protein